MWLWSIWAWSAAAQVRQQVLEGPLAGGGVDCLARQQAH